ncbi:pyruvate, water dikinase regulatory protein [Candidatus Venteria ishoeyi]|uniref:posphoenolpyruvate synthetase regulatory kinase/phosphorylase PpsR n=1 Tax=Candidatus Venteria ishoeyi TaxID=1899563 RepID=UPI0025A5D711|nr:pyruvate, water dikinase regulatory protein [Candidatus Venteria ishoeyi]MDM8544973.1 pyruvate, water dikinase regulatory protein [Candidatus Venteria ishoeyi]
MKRAAFFVSDRTAITAEMMGHSLLTQFESIEFEQINLPFIDSVEKAEQAVVQINAAAEHYACKPLLFITLIDRAVIKVIEQSEGMIFDLLNTFIHPLEQELGIHSAHAVGRSHGMRIYSTYKLRIDALNFSLANDDGNTLKHFPKADIILLGVSRSGKTPSCLFLALQYGILAANYPLVDDDLESSRLPEVLKPYRDKLFGLTIAPERLQQIRKERRPDSSYAEYQQCQYEVNAVEKIYRAQHIPFLDTSAVSIEEIATTILQTSGLERRLHG